jgi:hypothetical protein
MAYVTFVMLTEEASEPDIFMFGCFLRQHDTLLFLLGGLFLLYAKIRGPKNSDLVEK